MARNHKTQYYLLVSILEQRQWVNVYVYTHYAHTTIAVPLPQFEGLDSEVASPHVGATAAATGPAMTITPEEREKYYSIFRVHQPAGGTLDGASAKNIFMKSKLPTEALDQIW